MIEPEPETEPDVDYAEGFCVVSYVHEDPKPRESPIPTLLHEISLSMNSSGHDMEELQRLRAQTVDQLREITVSTNSEPNWQAICAMLSRAGSLQPSAILCSTAGCTRPAATTDNMVKHRRARAFERARGYARGVLVEGGARMRAQARSADVPTKLNLPFPGVN